MAPGGASPTSTVTELFELDTPVQDSNVAITALSLDFLDADIDSYDFQNSSDAGTEPYSSSPSSPLGSPHDFDERKHFEAPSLSAKSFKMKPLDASPSLAPLQELPMAT